MGFQVGQVVGVGGDTGRLNTGEHPAQRLLQPGEQFDSALPAANRVGSLAVRPTARRVRPGRRRRRTCLLVLPDQLGTQRVGEIQGRPGPQHQLLFGGLASQRLTQPVERQLAVVRLLGTQLPVQVTHRQVGQVVAALVGPDKVGGQRGVGGHAVQLPAVRPRTPAAPASRRAGPSVGSHRPGTPPAPRRRSRPASPDRDGRPPCPWRPPGKARSMCRCPGRTCPRPRPPPVPRQRCGFPASRPLRRWAEPCRSPRCPPPPPARVRPGTSRGARATPGTARCRRPGRPGSRSQPCQARSSGPTGRGRSSTSLFSS